ncbi:MAG: glycosyltransferase family 39 protein [Planctomycetota bacterium]|jgi:hypothetical protein
MTATTSTGQSPLVSALGLVERYHWLLALGLLALGLTLRIGGLSGYWLNPDEGIYYRIATETDGSRLQALIFSNAHPPFFYLLLLAMAGVSENFVWLRVPSLVGGCLAIVGVYMVGRRLAGTTAGLCAGLMMALSPGAIQQSEIIRPYGVLLAILAWSFFFLLRYLSDRRRKDLWAYSLLLFLGIGWHYSVFIIAAGLVPLYLGMIARKRFCSRELLHLVMAHLPAALLAGGLFWTHIQAKLMGQGIQATAQDGWLSIFFPDSASEMLRCFQGVFFLSLGEDYAGAGMLLFLLGLVFAGLGRAWASLSIVLGCLVVAMIMAILEQYPLGHSRHSIYLLPVILIPISQAVGLPLRKPLKVSLVWVVLLGLVALFPRTLNGFSGVDAVQFSRVGEQLSKWDTMDRVRRILMDEQEKGRVMIMDDKTLHVMIPIFRPDWRRFRRRPGPPLYSHFRWGDCWVIYSGTWSLHAGIGDRDESKSLEALVNAVDRRLPQIGIKENEDVLILNAGWSRPLAADLKKLDGEQARGEKLLSGGYSLKGMTMLNLNMRRYLELMN